MNLNVPAMARDLRYKHAGGGEYKGPCPVCGGHDRAWLKEGRTGTVIFQCRHCGDGPYRWLVSTRGAHPMFRRDRVSTPVPSRPKKNLEQVHSLWNSAEGRPSCLVGHPYAERKGITDNFGARRGRHAGQDVIVVPQRNIFEELVGLELISADGSKKTLGNKGHLIYGNACNTLAMVHVVEGWATGYAIQKYFPQYYSDRTCVVAIAFGGGIEKLGKLIAKEFPAHLVVTHPEPNNRDFWDVWKAGEAETYVRSFIDELRNAGEL